LLLHYGCDLTDLLAAKQAKQMARPKTPLRNMDRTLYYHGEKKTMANAKLVWMLMDFLGIPLTLLGIIANLDNVKSAILAILGIIYLMVRIYFYVIQKQQAVREKEYELWNKEQDKIDRIQKTSFRK
jgi:hypothetical protein